MFFYNHQLSTGVADLFNTLSTQKKIPTSWPTLFLEPHNWNFFGLNIYRHSSFFRYEIDTPFVTGNSYCCTDFCNHYHGAVIITSSNLKSNVWENSKQSLIIFFQFVYVICKFFHSFYPSFVFNMTLASSTFGTEDVFVFSIKGCTFHTRKN